MFYILKNIVMLTLYKKVQINFNIFPWHTGTYFWTFTVYVLDPESYLSRRIRIRLFIIRIRIHGSGSASMVFSLFATFRSKFSSCELIFVFFCFNIFSILNFSTCDTGLYCMSSFLIFLLFVGFLRQV